MMTASARFELATDLLKGWRLGASPSYLDKHGGRRQVAVRQTGFIYGESLFLLTAADLPIVSWVAEALATSKASPEADKGTDAHERRLPSRLRASAKFKRAYGRFFGQSPMRDSKLLVPRVRLPRD